MVKRSRKGERQVVGGCEVYAYLYVNGGVGEGCGDEGGGLLRRGFLAGEGAEF